MEGTFRTLDEAQRGGREADTKEIFRVLRELRVTVRRMEKEDPLIKFKRVYALEMAKKIVSRASPVLNAKQLLTKMKRRKTITPSEKALLDFGIEVIKEYLKTEPLYDPLMKQAIRKKLVRGGLAASGLGLAAFGVSHFF